MNEIFNRLQADVFTRKIDEKDFVRQYFSQTGVLINDTFCVNILEESIAKQDPDGIDDGIFLISIIGPSHMYSEILSDLLLAEWHFKHEDIVMITVDCLYLTAFKKLPYLDYDDTFGLARKCIYALAAIQTSDAINKIKLLTTNPNEVISKYAKKELNIT